MEITFTHAEEKDLADIVATYNATIPSRLVTADLEPVSVVSRMNWFRSHSPDRRPLWVVKANGEYAGWMSFSSFYGRPAYDGTAELSLYLEESKQGLGFGKACMAYAIETAPRLEVHTLLGFIFGHNSVSLALFKKFGFQEWGRLPGVASMDGVRRDLVILGKEIGE
jgi:L-amino acid N-acyltransferase YncA